MADNTGAPHFIPYVEPTDLVREYPAADEASAFAVAAALDAAGGLVALKSAIKTNVQTGSISTGGGTVAVAGLSIDHAVTEVGNRVVLMAQVYGSNQFSPDGGLNGIRIKAGATNLDIGDAAGSRTSVGGGGGTGSGVGNQEIISGLTFAQTTPADTATVSYSVDFVNVRAASANFHINRTRDDTDTETRPRLVSFLFLMEVRA